METVENPDDSDLDYKPLTLTVQPESRVLMDASQFQATLVLHNNQQPCDINGNGIVEPTDALILVN